ncbi:hypothetical protein VP01_714g3 [Puccinia sorghi]|uniref:Uncharacterized protein n=1 Tax=Puccinia sorghi TaxID=27349 RepID=A0A0L6UFL3_9BASI|nr:hypothetical protein VP01_714g3 [Puccinia sorghi]
MQPTCYMFQTKISRVYVMPLNSEVLRIVPWWHMEDVEISTLFFILHVPYFSFLDLTDTITIQKKSVSVSSELTIFSHLIITQFFLSHILTCLFIGYIFRLSGAPLLSVSAPILPLLIPLIFDFKLRSPKIQRKKKKRTSYPDMNAHQHTSHQGSDTCCVLVVSCLITSAIQLQLFSYQNLYQSKQKPLACCDSVLTVVLRVISLPGHRTVQPYVIIVKRYQLRAEGFPLSLAGLKTGLRVAAGVVHLLRRKKRGLACRGIQTTCNAICKKLKLFKPFFFFGIPRLLWTSTGHPGSHCYGLVHITPSTSVKRKPARQTNDCMLLRRNKIHNLYRTLTRLIDSTTQTMPVCRTRPRAAAELAFGLGHMYISAGSSFLAGHNLTVSGRTGTGSRFHNGSYVRRAL